MSLPHYVTNQVWFPVAAVASASFIFMVVMAIILVCKLRHFYHVRGLLDRILLFSVVLWQKASLFYPGCDYHLWKRFLVDVINAYSVLWRYHFQRVAADTVKGNQSVIFTSKNHFGHCPTYHSLWWASIFKARKGFRHTFLKAWNETPANIYEVSTLDRFKNN